LIPESEQPLKQCQIIKNYIHHGNKLMDDAVFEHDPPRILVTIYYLLADYHFKTKDFSKAKQFYIFDLTINPRRLASWAGLALSVNYQIDQMLLEGNINSNCEKFQQTTLCAIRCFEQALKLEENNSEL